MLVFFLTQYLLKLRIFFSCYLNEGCSLNKDYYTTNIDGVKMIILQDDYSTPECVYESFMII